jgi:hypothetical protein
MRLAGLVTPGAAKTGGSDRRSAPHRRPFTRSVEFPKVALLAHGTRRPARGLGAPQSRPLRLRRARERSQPVDSDDFGETIARFAAPAERPFLEWRGAAELQMHRSALMARAQRLAGEHCGRCTTGTSSTSLGSCPVSDFVELLGATRAETSGLARCHGAAGELQNGYVQMTAGV